MTGGIMPGGAIKVTRRQPRNFIILLLLETKNSSALLAKATIIKVVVINTANEQRLDGIRKFLPKTAI